MPIRNGLPPSAPRQSLRDFEVTVVKRLTATCPGLAEVGSFASELELVSYAHVGSSYFLTVKHDRLPQAAIRCEESLGAVSVGIRLEFSVFVEAGLLLIECNAAAPAQLPSLIRDLPVDLFVH